MSKLLSCPTCGETTLYSVETAAVAYPARFTVEGDVEYTGDEYITYDEGCEFEDLIDCRSCDRQEMRKSDLVPADEWEKR